MAAQISKPETIHELSAVQRIERLVLVVSLIGLSLTGLPQKYSTESWAHTLIIIGGGIESLRILHRVFALLLMAEAVYHVLSIAYRVLVIRLRPVMLPGLRDVTAFFGRIAANLGLRREESAPSYQFVLKFEYLLLVISGIVLIITGLMLWNPIRTTAALPGEAIPAAQTIHSNQALLTIVILMLLRLGITLLWHPNRAELMTAHAPKAASLEQIKHRRRIFIPIALVIAVIAAGAVIAFITGEQTAITTVPRRRAVIYAPQTLPTSGDPQIGAVLWGTMRCGFCHGENGEGGIRGEPTLRPPEISYAAFYEQVRIGRGEMPAFTNRELPDGYLVHLWAWLSDS